MKCVFTYLKQKRPGGGVNASATFFGLDLKLSVNHVSRVVRVCLFGFVGTYCVVCSTLFG